LINGLSDAIRGNKEEVIKAVKNILSTIAGAFGSLAGSIVDIGKSIIGGLIDGIKGKAKDVADATMEVMKGGTDAAKDTFEQKSPSKVFEQIGKYNGEGLIIGMKKMQDKIASASGDMANSATNPMGDISKRLADLIGSNVNFQPTIRPVIDLSDVEKGLDSTFGKTQGINVTTATNKASSIAATTSQNGSRTDVTTPSTATSNVDMSKINIVNNYQVRSSNDIDKISKDQRTLIDKYIRSKGVPVT
jgi:hypothetical protein